MKLITIPILMTLILCLMTNASYTDHRSTIRINPAYTLDSQINDIEQGISKYWKDSVREKVTNGYWRFSVDLIDKLQSNTKDNVIVSPLSLSMLLSLIANGASEQACAEILTALGATSLLELNVINQYLMSDWEVKRKGVIFALGNSIWTDNHVELTHAFTKVARDVYMTNCFRTALSSRSAMNQINNWVEENTNGLIPILLSSPLPPESHIIAVNTAYFKGLWNIPFDKEDSEEKLFHSQNGETNKVMTMHSWDDYLYLENEKYHAIKLDYKNKDFHMIVYMPRDGYTLDDLTQTLVMGEKYSRSIQEVILSLPRFKVEYEKSNYEQLLKKMGVVRLFSDSYALSKMTDVPTTIDGIMQKAYVSIDEEGTEAAAASATIYQTAPNPQAMPEPIRFTVDRPFVFMIRESSSGCVLFAGIIRNL